MDNEKLIICADHAGYRLKEYLKNKLLKENINIIDCSEQNEVNDDYPDIISKGAKAISTGKYKKGIFICGSGVGASITANRYKGVRAALVFNKKVAKLSREHNDSNVIVFGGRLINFKKAYRLFKVWLNTKFTQEKRHVLRINKIDRLGN